MPTYKRLNNDKRDYIVRTLMNDKRSTQKIKITPTSCDTVKALRAELKAK
ncbi:MAG: hypothetical protein R3Y59_10280 [bacterium]